MKLAMAMSMGDSQTLPDQEMGVLEHNTLRPATREHYETEKWAMTVAEPQTQEIFLNPDPTDRKRVMGGPAFFKPSPAGHRLPALLKILHAIPMARETLLNRTYTLPDYGVDKDWWDGTPIKFLRVVNLDLEGRQVNSDDLLYESQRLMAFLDETERAYGSTDALAKLEVFKDSHIDKVTDFYVGWHDATFHSVPGAPLADVFKSVGTKVSMDNPQSEPFYCLNARIDGEIAGKGLTLHDVLGHVLWSDNQADEETYLEKVGDVFTLEVCNQVTNSSGLGIEVPATWYVDRYLPSFAKQIKNMLSRKAQASADWDAQEKAQAGMALYTGSPTGAYIDASRLLSRAITYFEQTADYRGAIDDSSKTNAGFENDPPTSKTVGELAQELKALEASIAAKMRGSCLKSWFSMISTHALQTLRKLEEYHMHRREKSHKCTQSLRTTRSSLFAISIHYVESQQLHIHCMSLNAQSQKTSATCSVRKPRIGSGGNLNL